MSKWQPKPLTELNDTDAQALFELLSPFTHLESRQSFELNLRHIISNPSSVMMVVCDNGKIVGCGIGNLVFKSGRSEARLDEIVVSETMRGQGVGRTISQAIIDWAKESGAAIVELTSRPARESANHLYQSLGFRLRETNVYTLNF